MATGTGKTYTTFQIIWRLWKARVVKRTLFLVDRNILADQTLVNDFKPFGSVMTKIKNRKIDPAYEIHLGLYQAITGPDEEDKIFKNVSPDFFDMIIIDECHPWSAAADSDITRNPRTFLRRETDRHDLLTQRGPLNHGSEQHPSLGEPVYT